MPKILIADEGPDIRTLLDRVLDQGEIEILFASTGAEAVAQIEREAPDLVVSDVYMPDMDGYRLCEFVKSHPRLGATPVVLLADVVDATVLARAARVRPDDLLRKPFGPDALLARIRSLLPPPPRAERSRPGPQATSETEAAADLESVLDQLGALPGVALCVLVDEEGFLIEGAGEMMSEAEAVGAVLARLAASLGTIASELGRGRLRGMSLECDGAFLLLADAGDRGTLGVVLRDPSRLQAVRRAMAQAVPAGLGREGIAAMGAA